MKTKLSRSVICLLALVGLGCPWNPPLPHTTVNSFAWSPDGTKIIAITDASVLTFNLQGTQLSSVPLAIPLGGDGMNPNLYFSKDRKRFFGQAGMTVVLVDPETGSEQPLLDTAEFVCASASGRTIFVQRHSQFGHTVLGRVIDLSGSVPREIAHRTFAEFDLFPAGTFLTDGAAFIGDSELVAGDGPAGTMSFTVFDTSMQILFTTGAHEFPEHPVVIDSMHAVLYNDDSDFRLFDIRSNNIIALGGTPATVTAITARNGLQKFFFVVSGARNFRGDPGTLESFDFNTHKVASIATLVGNDPQLSPDGSLLAFFVSTEGGGELHVIPTK